MINNILSNINASELNKQQKIALKSYVLNLNRDSFPIIFDVNQIKHLFDLLEVDILEEFMEKNIDKYTKIKKSGSLREVHKPSYKLKKIQKWILKKMLYQIQLPDCVHGFIKGKSILSNAKAHVHDSPFWIHNIDIKDFFPSIDVKRVKKVFLDFGYSDEVSDYLSQLCTFNGELVQGFPTSPMLANIIFKDIDYIILNIVKKYNIVYTRYADDLTFSGPVGYNYIKKISSIHSSVEYVINDSGFKLNKLKTRTIKGNKPKVITGLIVSETGVSVPKKYIKLLDKELYYCKKYGVSDHLKYNGLITIANYKGYLIGLARFIYMIEKDVGSNLLKEINQLDWD